MSNSITEEIIQQLKTGKPVCVCKPFCGHWEAHAAKVLSGYLSRLIVEPDTVQLRNAAITYAKKHSPIAAIKFVADQLGVVGLIGDSEIDTPPRHHKNCSIWTVTRDGDKNVCDCGLERKQFLEHLERASKLAATWEPWERHIFSSAPCGVDSCPCQTVANKGDDLRGVVPCRRCGCLPEVSCLFLKRGDLSWVASCESSACRARYFGLTRDEAVEYWNMNQLKTEPYPFGRVRRMKVIIPKGAKPCPHSEHVVRHIIEKYRAEPEST